MAILQETPQINKNKLKTTCLLGENQAIISEPQIFKTHPNVKCPQWSGNLPHKQLQENAHLGYVICVSYKYTPIHQIWSRASSVNQHLAKYINCTCNLISMLKTITFSHIFPHVRRKEPPNQHLSDFQQNKPNQGCHNYPKGLGRCAIYCDVWIVLKGK